MLNIEENKEVIDKIINISNEIEEELEKDTINEEKIFKLRYQQLIKGFYLNQMNNNFRY